jgi:hypothetical protein
MSSPSRVTSGHLGTAAHRSVVYSTQQRGDAFTMLPFPAALYFTLPGFPVKVNDGFSSSAGPSSRPLPCIRQIETQLNSIVNSQFTCEVIQLLTKSVIDGLKTQMTCVMKHSMNWEMTCEIGSGMMSQVSQFVNS